MRSRERANTESISILLDLPFRTQGGRLTSRARANRFHCSGALMTGSICSARVYCAYREKMRMTEREIGWASYRDCSARLSLFAPLLSSTRRPRVYIYIGMNATSGRSVNDRWHLRARATASTHIQSRLATLWLRDTCYVYVVTESFQSNVNKKSRKVKEKRNERVLTTASDSGR